MNRTNWIIVSAIILLAACNRNGSLRHFIPGVYVTEYNNSYARGKDTIMIKPFGAHSYEINRATTFQRFRDQKWQPTERTQRSYAGTFQTNTQTILESKEGIIISFDPANNWMKWGAMTYIKIQ